MMAEMARIVRQHYALVKKAEKDGGEAARRLYAELAEHDEEDVN